MTAHETHRKTQTMSQSDTAPARRTPPTFVPRAFTASWMLGCGVFLLAPLSAAKAEDEQTQPAHTHKAGLSRHVPAAHSPSCLGLIDIHALQIMAAAR